MYEGETRGNYGQKWKKYKWTKEKVKEVIWDSRNTVPGKMNRNSEVLDRFPNCVWFKNFSQVTYFLGTIQ